MGGKDYQQESKYNYFFGVFLFYFFLYDCSIAKCRRIDCKKFQVVVLR
jgi:hypothetical protein